MEGFIYATKDGAINVINRHDRVGGPIEDGRFVGHNALGRARAFAAAYYDAWCEPSDLGGIPGPLGAGGAPPQSPAPAV